jgi:hypothetical protein
MASEDQYKMALLTLELCREEHKDIWEGWKLLDMKASWMLTLGSALLAWLSSQNSKHELSFLLVLAVILFCTCIVLAIIALYPRDAPSPFTAKDTLERFEQNIDAKGCVGETAWRFAIDEARRCASACEKMKREFASKNRYFIFSVCAISIGLAILMIITLSGQK